MGFEGPRAQWLWHLPEFLRLSARCRLRPIHYDGCAHGLKGPDGRLHKRPSTLWCSTPALERLGARCPGESASHVHGGPLSGKVKLHGRLVPRSVLASIYPPDLVEVYAEAVADLYRDLASRRV